MHHLAVCGLARAFTAPCIRGYPTLPETSTGFEEEPAPRQNADGCPVQSAQLRVSRFPGLLSLLLPPPVLSVNSKGYCSLLQRMQSTALQILHLYLISNPQSGALSENEFRQL